MDPGCGPSWELSKKRDEPKAEVLVPVYQQIMQI
jgi:hypothetical protein